MLFFAGVVVLNSAVRWGCCRTLVGMYVGANLE